MKIIYTPRIRLQSSLSREEAEDLLKLLTWDGKKFENLISDLEYLLAPRYEYTVKCSECRNKFTVASRVEPSKEELKQKGICADCMDDYK